LEKCNNRPERLRQSRIHRVDQTDELPEEDRQENGARDGESGWVTVERKLGVGNPRDCLFKKFPVPVKKLCRRRDERYTFADGGVVESGKRGNYGINTRDSIPNR
jgi:hypothetical protein